MSSPIPPLPSIFLSHSHTDKPFARKLGHALQKHGIKVWIDEAEIKVGDSLIRKLSQGVADANYVAAILSPDSISSAWVQKELEIATTLEIKGKRVKVLPLLYRECDVPLFLVEKLYADFRSASRFVEALNQLLDAIRPRELEQVILDTVRAAIRAEFEAYKALPEYRDVGLAPYFSEDGSARQRIIHLLARHSEKGWTIKNEGNPSTVEVYRVSTREIRAAWAWVETDEYWYLRWHDSTNERHPPIFRRRSCQQYVLEQQADGKWLIVSNYYPGKARQRFAKLVRDFSEKLFGKGG